jgi:hypothetical protein
MTERGSKKAAPAAAAKRGTQAKKAAKAGSVMTPLEYMLSVVGDENATATARMNAAKSAAPYVHAKADGSEPAAAPEKIGEALRELIRRAQDEGEGVAGLIVCKATPPTDPLPSLKGFPSVTGEGE